MADSSTAKAKRAYSEIPLGHHECECGHRSTICLLMGLSDGIDGEDQGRI